MATNTWVASSAGVWSNASNWSLSHKPQIGEDTLFDGTGTGKCTLDENTAQLNTFIISDTNTADFDDGGFNIDTDSTINIKISNLITLTLNGTLTVHGDGDLIIDGNQLGDHTDGYFIGNPSIDCKGTGALNLFWYFVQMTPEYIVTQWSAINTRRITCAYSGKTTGMGQYDSTDQLVLKGGILDLTYGSFFVKLGENYLFTIDTGTQITCASYPGYPYKCYFILQNTTPQTFDLPTLDYPSLVVYFITFLYEYNPAFLYADATINFIGDNNLKDIIENKQDTTPYIKANYTFNFNGTFNLSKLILNNDNSTKTVSWHFNNSTINLLCGINTHVNQSDYGAGRLKLYLERAQISCLGQNTDDPLYHENQIWFVGWHNIDVIPGTSRVTLTPAVNHALGLGQSEPELGGYYAFYDLFVESGAGHFTIIEGDLIVEHEFRWSNNGSFIWGDPPNQGLSIGGNTTVQLNSDFHGRLFSKIPGQVVTWETLNGSQYIIDYSIPGDIGAFPSITWDGSASTPFQVNFPTQTLAGVSIRDCTNSGSLVKVSRTTGTIIDSTGFELASASVFTSPTVSDGTAVTSTLDRASLVALAQITKPGDTYFDATSKIVEAIVYYTDPAGRQTQYARFSGETLSGAFTWEPGAADGTWTKSKIVLIDSNNAKVTLTNAGSETITHSGGQMTLNTN